MTPYKYLAIGFLIISFIQMTQGNYKDAMMCDGFALLLNDK